MVGKKDYKKQKRLMVVLKRLRQKTQQKQGTKITINTFFTNS